VAKFLLTKGKAGLGNRLLAALGSIVYARVSGRQLYIDWSDRGYSKDRSNSFPRFFARPQLADPAAIWDSESVTPAIWRGHLRESVDELIAKLEPPEAENAPSVSAKYTIDVARIDHSEDIAVRWAWTDELYRMRQHFRGAHAALRALSDEAVLRQVIRNDVALAPELQQRVDEFASRELSDVNIGLHIRYSDRKNSFDIYPMLVDRILARHPKATIFVATDNQDVEKQFRDRYPRVAVTKKWYPPPGVPLHRVPNCPDKFELGVEALTDLWLLGRCQYLVYNDTSTFGVMAHLLSSAPRGNVFETSPRSSKVVRRVKQWGKQLRVLIGG
jgi:hypothetical protein